MTDDPFVTHRSLLFTVAYEMLGSAADAEDVVQETWLRWADVDRAEVRDPRAYLVRIVTRQALNRLRTLARRREEYVGEWLPEPLLTSPDVAEDVEFAESVSIAMLTVLETLAPAERAVFVLREVFDLPYADIAAAVDKTPAAVRQIAHRAREHVAARRPRIQVDRAEQQQVVDRFLAALRTGDLQVLLDVLAPDVVLVADGGGEVAAVRRPVVGRDRVATLLSRFKTRRAGCGGRHRVAERRARRPDRSRRRARHGGQPGGRGRPDHPHLRDPQPAQARPAGRRGHAQPLTAVAAGAPRSRRPRGILRCREWPRSRSAPARSGPRRGRRDRSGVPRHAGAAVRAARPGARVLGDAEGGDAQPGPELQGARHGDGGSRGARRGCGARGVRERRQSRAGAGVQRRASRPGRHGRGSEDRQPAQAAPDRGVRRRRAAGWRGHRGRAAAGAGDRGGGRRLPRRGQPGPRDLRGRRDDRARARSRRSGARRRARVRRRRGDGQRRGLRRCARSPSTWR